MIFLDGEPTPLPEPPWETTTFAPLDHGGLLIAAPPGWLLPMWILVILALIGGIGTIYASVFYLHELARHWRGREPKMLSRLFAVLQIVVPCAIAAVIAFVLIFVSLPPDTSSMVKWSSSRYDISLGDNSAATLSRGDTVVIPHLGLRIEIHATKANDGRLYLFDASGNELPTTVSTNTGGN